MYTVLIVDDNADLTALLGIMLERLGCRSIGARNGVDGQIQAIKIRPDLILLDVMMDEQDGYTTCKNLRAEGYTGRIIFISALTAMIGMARAQECGADCYIEKPITLKILKEQITALEISTG